ncbi:hypothetical protein [Bradyrhizobium sp. CCBAU 53338]|uniref:hypothetical protein n=1 Tax=Bradyrhizobium sp. CCBAU 53338 TaxID=1325111 RepID=UPI00188AD4F8|nr:hypothetical protein [Bradyrhizobium sp. CCBAU 53338]QOZ52882.1 hypothetical protein XH90_17060 [Bradyrhizobium sp. CCBAU 53338]
MNTISEDIMVVVDLTNLLVVLLAQPDAETAIDGMHKVAQVISDRARSIQDQVERQVGPRRVARVR